MKRASRAGADRRQAQGRRPAAGRGQGLPEVVKVLEVTEASYHRRRARYGGMQADDAKR